MPFQEVRVSAGDGLSLYVRDYHLPGADGTPLLCLPGLTRNSKDFAALAAAYAPRRRVVAVDYRGRGRSAYDPDWRHYSVPTYLDDIGHVAAALGLHRAVAIGTSLGGLLSLGLAVMKPTLLAGIVLNDIGPDLGPGIANLTPYLQQELVHADWPTTVAFLKANLPPQSIADEAGWLAFAKGHYIEGDDGKIRCDWDPMIREPLRRANGAVPDLWPPFRAAARLPMMVVRGGVSDFLTEDGLARMQSEKPDLVAVTVPGIGHTPSLSEPLVIKALDDFLRPL